MKCLDVDATKMDRLVHLTLLWVLPRGVYQLDEIVGDRLQPRIQNRLTPFRSLVLLGNNIRNAAGFQDLGIRMNIHSLL